MSDKDVELKIGADGSQAEAEFSKVGNAAEKAGQRIQETIREASYNMAASTKAATEQMSSQFSKLTDSFASVNKMLGAFTAVLAGGAVFKSGIDESNKLTGEATKLGKQLGITATEASVLNVALGDVYIETDTMLAANQKLTKTLGTNEKAFKDLGVATRDQNGNFRSSLDIMLDTNAHLLKFKEGIDRNIEGQKIYGKQWAEVQGILKLNPVLMEESRKKAEELGLIIGKENVEATLKYKASMNDVGDVLSAFKKTTGDSLIPILTDLGNQFSNVGPAAVSVMRAAMQTLAEAMKGVIYAVKELGSIIGAIFGEIGNAVNSALGEKSLTGMELFINMTKVVRIAIASLATGFVELMEVIRGAFNVLVKATNFSSEGMTKEMEASAARLAKIRADYLATVDEIVLGGGVTPTTKKEGGAGSDGGADKGAKKSKMPEWKAELEARKEVEGQFFKNSLAEDEAFWQQKLLAAKGNAKEEIAVKHELFAIHKTLAVQKFTDEMDGLKAEEAAAKAGSLKRIDLAAQVATRVGETYGYESREYMAAIKEVQKTAEEWNKDQEKLEAMKIQRTRDHQLSEINMERDRLAMMKNLGQLSDQEEIAALKVLEEKKYQIEVLAQQDKIAMLKDDQVAQQQQLDELAKMQEKHDADMGKLDIQRVLAVKKSWDTMLGAVSGAFEQSLNGMIQGTQTFQKSMANIGQAISAEFIKMGVKKATTWGANELTMTAATVAGTTARGAAETAGATESMAVSGMTSIKSILNSAWETMANVYKSIAAIPVVGPVMAPMMAAGAFGVVAGVAGKIASSAGGEWQVPADRLNLVHKNETILPAHIAEPLRNMVTGGGGAANGGTHLHIHSAVADAKGFETWLKNNSSSLAPALRDLNRNFNKI